MYVLSKFLLLFAGKEKSKGRYEKSKGRSGEIRRDAGEIRKNFREKLEKTLGRNQKNLL
ncbi:MAG: hypothetical protein LBF22_09260 [Deltaproteobacteria bacterium]|nr:hypothetical protein [Deltaproteobacteria bacterium]